jgi:hypothetical protein
MGEFLDIIPPTDRADSHPVVLSFYCQGGTLLVYTVTTLASATAGSILPFQRWFNERRYKVGSRTPACRNDRSAYSDLPHRNTASHSSLGFA